MEQYNGPQTSEGLFNKWAIPVRMGLITGIVAIIIDTVNLSFVMPRNYIGFIGLLIVGFIVSVVLYIITGSQQRKAMGGYITFKDAFAAIFTAVIISVVMTTVYSIIYAKFIDPDLTVKMKTGTLEFMEKMHVPQDTIDEKMGGIDKQFAESTAPLGIVKSLLTRLVLYGVISLICALIIQRRPQQQMR